MLSQDKSENQEPFVNPSGRILVAIKEVLEQEKNLDPDWISLYEVARLIHRKKSEYITLIQSYERLFERKLYSPFCTIRDLDYENDVLNIKVGHAAKDYSFQRKNGDIFISSGYSDQALRLLDESLIRLFKKLDLYRGYVLESAIDRATFHPAFYVNMTRYGVDLHLDSGKQTSEFSLSFRGECKCNSSLVKTAVLGKEEELFKHIFLQIKDCPSWCQEELRKIRQEELDPRITVKLRRVLSRINWF